MFKPVAITATAVAIAAGGVAGAGLATQTKGNDAGKHVNAGKGGQHGPSKTAHRSFSALDQHFLHHAAMGNAFEVASGTAAQAKSANPAVDALGARLVADHTAALRKVQYIAGRLGVEVRAEPSPVQRWILDTMSDMPAGAAFDARFLALAVAAHQEDIEFYRYEARNGSHWAVRKYAREQLPVLEEHLEAAETALGATPAGRD